ncbi:DEAD/DEAH box helicase, partial [Streptomyces diastaticus]
MSVSSTDHTVLPEQSQMRHDDIPAAEAITPEAVTAELPAAGLPVPDEAARADAAVDTELDAGTTDEADESDSEDDGVTFAALGLPVGVVRKLAQNGVTKPFPIQAATIPDALAGKDI